MTLNLEKWKKWFSNGAIAGVLNGDPRIPWLWKNLVENQSLENSKNNEITFPWETCIEDIARNHESGNVYTGDMFRFTPGALSYIARKIILFKDTHSQIKSIPETFFTPQGEKSLNRNVMETAWAITGDLLKSCLPESRRPPDYAVKIDILKYPSYADDLDRILMLLGDSSGYWTRRGMYLDRMKSMAVGFFDRKAVRDLFALGTLIPGLSIILHRVNASLMSSSKKKTPLDKRLVGEPHIDNPNFVTSLISDRDTLSTEVDGEGGWVELPLSCDSIAFFPSGQIREYSTTTPTIHRILMSKEKGDQEVKKPNITLLLAAIPWPQKFYQLLNIISNVLFHHSSDPAGISLLRIR